MVLQPNCIGLKCAVMIWRNCSQ